MHKLNNLRIHLLKLSRSKPFWTINSLVFLFLLSYFFLFIQVKDFNYFPQFKQLEFNCFSDKEKFGDSESELKVVKDSILEFNFELGEKDQYPYAGINLNVKNKQELDLSKYNRIAIEFTPYNLDHMSLFLNVEDKDVKNKAHLRATRRMLSDLFVDRDQGRQTSVVSFDDMESPNWWYEEMNQSKKEFGDPDWRRLTSMSITNGINSEANIYHEFKVHNIYFFRDYSFDIAILLIIQIVSFLITGFLFYVKSLQKLNENKTRHVEINYKPIELDKQTEDEKVDFLSYIHTEFSNPELSLTIIAEETKVDPKIISETIAEQFDCNLKTYINRIRITEAKRLLKESELNINEVAYLVGFNSPGHFNRVFKIVSGYTPSEFKKL
jgi:AraC-like DNA-binding protein